MRLNLLCECGNRDDMDFDGRPGDAIFLPPCSAECGRTMRIDWTTTSLTLPLPAFNLEAASGVDEGEGSFTNNIDPNADGA